MHCPSCAAVYKNVAKYTVNGTSCNLNKGLFLWGYSKSKVYTTTPANLDDLKMRIRNEMDIHRQDIAMVRRAVNSMTARAELCLQRNGGNVED